MSLWKETLRRLAYLGRRSRFDADLDTEVEFHIETRADELARAGMPRPTALAQARREFGSPARMAEETRSAWQFRWLEDLAADLHYAARAFRRNPAFAATAIACLALGIGANTTIFSIAAEVLFSQPSVRDPYSLVRVDIGGNSASPVREYEFLRDAHTFPGLAGENEEMETNWRDSDNTYRLSVVRVTDNFFDVTGIPVALGRPIQPGDSDRVVLTYGFWQRRLGGAPDVIGRKLLLDGRIDTVSAVLPRDHRTVTGFGFSPDLYAPVTDPKTYVTLYARLEPGTTRLAALSRLKPACQELDRAYPDGNHKWANNLHVSAVSGIERIDTEHELMRPVAGFFAVLMVVVGLVLLIACANVASLLLARASSRSHELAVRLSIGAGRGRIVRQLLAESLLLSACGTGAGLAINIGLTTLLSRIQLPLPIPIQFLIQPDWRLLAYAAAVALVCSLAASLAPAVKGTGVGISAMLKHGEHQLGRHVWTLRNVLVVGQLAASIVLLCAGFLFLRNLVNASAMSPGFDIEHTVWAYMRLVPESYRDPAKTRGLVDAAVERLRSLPGVETAAIARVVPLNNNMRRGTEVSTDLNSHGLHVEFHINYVGPGYFQAMQIPIVTGREFLPADRKGAPRVAILNQNLARRVFGAVDPARHFVRFGQGETILVAGVAKNSKYFSLGEENALAYYEPYDQSPGPVADLHFLVRATGRPEPLIPGINTSLGQLDPTASLEIKPMSKALVFAMLPSRVGAAILGSMGMLGLLLASVGLYGVLLYSVSRRIREIGLRVALGATPAGILRLVLRQSAVLSAAGIGIGMALAVFAVRPLARFLSPEVRPADLMNFVVVGAVLAAVALAATLSPAVRALRVDPVEALRHE